MPDLAAALESFQEALLAGNITIAPSLSHHNLHVFQDNAEGQLRITCAWIIEGEVFGIVVFVPVEDVESTTCFNVGYAVDPAHRNTGVGGKIVDLALSELKNILSQYGNGQYCVEAVINTQNDPSNKIARKCISPTPKNITCQVSGDDAFQYIKHYKF
jgi:RimJ/RimL family protein N-acetyltransferase